MSPTTNRRRRLLLQQRVVELAARVPRGLDGCLGTCVVGGHPQEAVVHSDGDDDREPQRIGQTEAFSQIQRQSAPAIGRGRGDDRRSGGEASPACCPRKAATNIAELLARSRKGSKLITLKPRRLTLELDDL